MSPNANKNKTLMALNVPANKSIKFVSYGFAEVLMSATEKQTRLRHHENNLDSLQLQFINKNNKIKLPCSFVRTDLHLLSNLFFWTFPLGELSECGPPPSSPRPVKLGASCCPHLLNRLLVRPSSSQCLCGLKPFCAQTWVEKKGWERKRRRRRTGTNEHRAQRSSQDDTVFLFSVLLVLKDRTKQWGATWRSSVVGCCFVRSSWHDSELGSDSGSEYPTFNRLIPRCDCEIILLHHEKKNALTVKKGGSTKLLLFFFHVWGLDHFSCQHTSSFSLSVFIHFCVRHFEIIKVTRDSVSRENRGHRITGCLHGLVFTMSVWFSVLDEIMQRCTEESCTERDFLEFVKVPCSNGCMLRHKLELRRSVVPQIFMFAGFLLLTKEIVKIEFVVRKFILYRLL